MVIIHYEGKSKPGSYRLGVVVDIEEDADGCVRTVTVEYSILSELSEKDRLEYKGITKKRLRVPVQRLVIILPVEERDTDTSTSEGIQNYSPGGTAGTTASGSKKTEGVVNKSADAYDVFWDSVNKKYVHASTGVSAGVQGDGQIQEQGEGSHKGHKQHHDVQELQDVEGVGGLKGYGGHELHHDVLVEDDQAHVRGAEKEKHVHGKEGFESEDKKFEKSYSENLKSCAILDTKFDCEDYEGVIYRELSRKIDWSQVFEDK